MLRTLKWLWLNDIINYLSFLFHISAYFPIYNVLLSIEHMEKYKNSKSYNKILNKSIKAQKFIGNFNKSIILFKKESSCFENYDLLSIEVVWSKNIFDVEVVLFIL